jgi:hypothetical protein
VPLQAWKDPALEVTHSVLCLFLLPAFSAELLVFAHLVVIVGNSK